MTTKVEFYRHHLGDEEAAAWRRTLASLFLTLGPEVAAFEAELARYLVRGRPEGTLPQVVGTNSCSAGLLLALRALDVSPGDEVITTPMTFAATVAAILHAGATPRLVDVDPQTGLIDPEAVRAAVGPRTAGIVPVHLYGRLADMVALRQIADGAGLFIVEDSAHGFEMDRDGVRPGDLSEAAVFSFYATKTMTCGDGGAVVTRDVRMAERLRRLRNHGTSKAAADRHGGPYQHWDVVELGYKANLSDLDAALLRPQLRRADERRSDRERLARRYETLLEARIEDFRSPTPANCRAPWLIRTQGTHSHHLFTVHAPLGRRDVILGALGALGVGTAVNYRPIHVLQYFSQALAAPLGSLPVAEEIGQRTISLPMFAALADSEQDYVAGALAEAWRG